VCQFSVLFVSMYFMPRLIHANVINVKVTLHTCALPREPQPEELRYSMHCKGSQFYLHMHTFIDEQYEPRLCLSCWWWSSFYRPRTRTDWRLKPYSRCAWYHKCLQCIAYVHMKTHSTVQYCTITRTHADIHLSTDCTQVSACVHPCKIYESV